MVWSSDLILQAVESHQEVITKGALVMELTLAWLQQRV